MTSYVYIIAVKDESGKFCAPVKVGMSDSPNARLAQLLTGSHVAMGIVHAFALPNREIATHIEKAFHKIKKKHRRRGEWFDMDPAEALLCMCINIDAAMASLTSLTEEETIQSWELTGWPYKDQPYHPSLFRS